MQYIDTVPIRVFNLRGVGECELRVIKENTAEKIAHPTAYIVKDNKDIICSLDILSTKYESKIDLKNAQKCDIYNCLNTAMKVIFIDIYANPWHNMCESWTDLNGRHDDLVFPENPPDYFGFRQILNK